MDVSEPQKMRLDGSTFQGCLSSALHALTPESDPHTSAVSQPKVALDGTDIETLPRPKRMKERVGLFLSKGKKITWVEAESFVTVSTFRL